MKNLVILGATGSVGRQTLSWVSTQQDWSLRSCVAHRDVDGMLDIIEKHHPAYAILVDEQAAEVLAARVSGQTVILGGESAMMEVLRDDAVDVVMAAIVGLAGLPSVVTALEAGHQVCLANKESLVLASAFLQEITAKNHAVVVPVDSEHSAVLDAWPQRDWVFGQAHSAIAGVTLTASGGALRDWALSDLHKASVGDVCQHPVWSMGKKITVDSATMFNKALEVVEAMRLFGLSMTEVDACVHPQGLVHALVHYREGYSLWQAAAPDMQMAIARALSWPHGYAPGFRPSLAKGEYGFYPIDAKRYPLYDTVLAASKNLNQLVAVNAWNEVLVAAFLAGDLRFTEIAERIHQGLSRLEAWPIESIEHLIHWDREVRLQATDYLDIPHAAC